MIIFDEKMINYLSVILAIISFAYAIYCRHVTKKTEKETRTINWQDINTATKHLAQQIGEKNKPDIIYIPNIKSGIIAYFIKDFFMEYIPIIVGQAIPQKQFSEDSKNKILNQKQYLSFQTNKWHCYIPKTILDYKDKKMLIIDDFAMSGDFLKLLKDTLIKAGFNEENIITVCIATTEVAIRSEAAPTFFWKKFSTTDIYMPWGKPL